MQQSLIVTANGFWGMWMQTLFGVMDTIFNMTCKNTYKSRG